MYEFIKIMYKQCVLKNLFLLYWQQTIYTRKINIKI